MEIRTATLGDVENLCNLFTEFFAYNAKLQPEYCNASIESGKYPEVVIKDKNADILIAIENGTIVGFMHILESKTPPYESVVAHRYAEIMAFMVNESCRRKNVSSKLMDAAKEWGKARKLDYGFDVKSHIMRHTL